MKNDDGRGRLNKRDYQIPVLGKELEEYKERQDDFMTGLGDSFLNRNFNPGERQRKGSNISNEGGDFSS